MCAHKVPLFSTAFAAVRWGGEEGGRGQGRRKLPGGYLGRCDDSILDPFVFWSPVKEDVVLCPHESCVERLAVHFLVLADEDAELHALTATPERRVGRECLACGGIARVLLGTKEVVVHEIHQHELEDEASPRKLPLWTVLLSLLPIVAVLLH